MLNISKQSPIEDLKLDMQHTYCKEKTITSIWVDVCNLITRTGIKLGPRTLEGACGKMFSSKYTFENAIPKGVISKQQETKTKNWNFAAFFTTDV